MRSLLTLISVGWMLGFGGLGLAQTKIERIRPQGEGEGWCQATGVSDDGTVVVGTGGYLRTFRWTELTDIQWISSTSYGDNSARFYPESMTADGASIYGTIQTDNGPPFPEGPYLWTLRDGLRKIGDLEFPIELASSADGSVVFAIEGKPTDAEGIYFLKSIKRRGLTGSWELVLGSDKLALGDYLDYFDIKTNQDGSTFVLISRLYEGRSRLFIWKEGEGFQQIPVSAGSEQEGSVKAYAISRDGTCVVGEIQTSSNTARAFLWTRAGGIRELGGLPGRTSSRATAVNGNGSIIVGSGGSLPNQNAFFWTESSGMRDLGRYLEEMGLDLTGWDLQEAVDISPDGKVIVGNGEYQGQASIFLITGLPPLTEAGPESFPVATTAFSLLILGWMAWYLGFRRKA